MKRIRNVVVLGAGKMAKGIVTLFASRKDVQSVFMADMALPQDHPDNPNFLAEAALAAIPKTKPPIVYTTRDLDNVQIGHFTVTDDGCEASEELKAALRAADIIIEVIAEDLEPKQKLFAMVARHWNNRAIVSSNTSGKDLNDIVAGLDEAFRAHCLVTHFFNPVRYMRLLELVAGNNTLPGVMEFWTDYGEDALGKWVVIGKMTPNFVANRTAVPLMQLCLQEMESGRLTVEAIDATCQIMGFGKPLDTCDIVGVDLMVPVPATTREGCPGDPLEELHQTVPIVEKMIEANMLGRQTRKTGGFYKGAGKDERLKTILHTLNPADMTHSEQASLPDILVLAGKAVKAGDHQGAIIALWEDESAVGGFARKIATYAVVYAAHLLGTICDTIVTADRAVMAGYNYPRGFFALADLIGLQRIADAAVLLEIHEYLPQWFTAMIRDGHTFYRHDGRQYYDTRTEMPWYYSVPRQGCALSVKEIRRDSKPIHQTNDATAMLYDDVVVVELHSAIVPTQNPVTADIIETVEAGLDYAEGNDHSLLIVSDGPNFSSGANLKLLRDAVKAGPDTAEWETMLAFLRRFWKLTDRLRYSGVPTCAVVHGYVLGGGCELACGCDVVVAADETYMGYVELLVGLTPGAGGILRAMEHSLHGVPDDVNLGLEGTMALLTRAFMTIGEVKVSSSGLDAEVLGHLRDDQDMVVCGTNERRIWTAFEVLGYMMSMGYTPPKRRMYRLPGPDGAYPFREVLTALVEGGRCAPHDVPVGLALAKVMMGGDEANLDEPVSEETLRVLDEEAFFTLCREPKTLERIEHMLRTNKPLRN